MKVRILGFKGQVSKIVYYKDYETEPEPTLRDSHSIGVLITRALKIGDYALVRKVKY